MAGCKEEEKLILILPEHVVEMDILPRLPFKSLIRFQSVSKHWRDLISDHLHHFRLPNVTSGLFFRFPISASNEFYAATTTTATHLSKTNIDTSLSFLPPQHNLHVIDCCNGLLLCRFFSHQQHDTVLCVCNPFTGEYTIIPELLYSSWESLVLLFDPTVSRHLKIIFFGKCVTRIFSSESGAWVSKPQIEHVYHELGHRLITENSVFLGGKIYLASERYPFLFAFNGEGDDVGSIHIPHPESGEVRPHLGHSRGHLYYAVKVFDEMRVWVLESFDTMRWGLRCSVSLEALLRRSPRGGDSDYPEILRFHPESDVVFVRVEGTLLSYHLGCGDLAKFCNCGTLKAQSAFPYSPFYSEDADL